MEINSIRIIFAMLDLIVDRSRHCKSPSLHNRKWEHPLAQLSDAVLTAHSLNSGLFYSLAEILKDLSFAHGSTRQAEKHGIRRHSRAHRNQTIEE